MLALETVQSVRTFTDERCHILTLDGVEVGRIGFGLDGVDLMIDFAVLDQMHCTGVEDIHCPANAIHVGRRGGNVDKLTTGD